MNMYPWSLLLVNLVVVAVLSIFIQLHQNIRYVLNYLTMKSIRFATLMAKHSVLWRKYRKRQSVPLRNYYYGRRYGFCITKTRGSIGRHISKNENKCGERNAY